MVDFSLIGPGPRCTRMLADYGARVVKVRPPGSADLLEAPVHAYSADRDIERIGVDLKAPAGLEVADRLVRQASVVVESFRPGVAGRLGIGYERLKTIRPGIVYCAISGYGQGESAASYPGHDLNYLGVAGYLATSGRDGGGRPALPGSSIADAAGGFAAAIAVLAALSAPLRPLEGIYLDVSVTDASLRFTQMFIDRYLATGEEVTVGGDQLLGGRACYGVYETSDGKWVTLGALEPRFWRRFCELTGLEDLVEQQHVEAAQGSVRAAVEAVIRARTRAEWMHLLANEVPVGPVNEISEVAEDPRLGGGPATWTVPASDGKNLRQMAPRLAGVPSHLPESSRVPALGSTNAQAILEEVGYSGNEIATLLRGRVVR